MSATVAPGSTAPSSFGNKIWGLRVVDMRLLFTIDMRDRLFGYVVRFQDYFKYDDVDGFRPKSLRVEEEDGEGAGEGEGEGGLSPEKEKEKKELQKSKDEDVRARPHDFQPHW